MKDIFLISIGDNHYYLSSGRTQILRMDENGYNFKGFAYLNDDLGMLSHDLKEEYSQALKIAQKYLILI